MYHNFEKNKKGSYYKGRKILFSAIIAALSTFPVYQVQARPNIFADIPLNLQNSSTITTRYSVKPNVTLLIDRSASMHEALTYKCKINVHIKIGKTYQWTGWSDYQYGYDSRPPNTKDTLYSCKKETDKLDGVKAVLLNILEDYHDDMYFAFRPLKKADDSTIEFLDTSIPELYQQIVNNINSAKASSGTPLTKQIPVVARNLVMNKLKYRCQKSYLVILTDGESDDTYAVSDAKVDGYFDEGKSDLDRIKFFAVGGKSRLANKPNRLLYYTKTLASKNFGPYIYSALFYKENGNKIYLSPKRTTDEAGQAWDATNELTGKPFEQKAETFTIGVGLGQKHNSIGNIAIDYLENGAMPAGNFFNANSQKEIIEAFSKIFESIKGSQDTTTTTTVSTAPTVAISSSTQNHLSITATTESGAWSSNLCIRQITDDNNAKCAQPSYGNRQLLLNDGTNTYLYSDNLSNFNNAYFKIDNDTNQNEWLKGLLTWLSRSKNDNDINQINGFNPGKDSKYRVRTDETRDLGDIIDNPIITAGDQNGINQKYMITSANDGMVYVFGATNDANHPYDLKFNFMPMNIERQSNDGSDLVSHYYKDLVDINYGKNSNYPHRFLLNGGMAVQQTEKRVDSEGKLLPQQTIMVSNMGQAGRGAFAINIGGKDLVSGQAVGVDNMGSEEWYKDISLFQTPTGKDNYFGFTVGTPAIARLRVNEDTDASATSVANHIREAAFINNGYNYSETLASNSAGRLSAESALYIYDILGVDVGTDGFQKIGSKGELIAKLAPKVNDDSDDEQATGGLSSPTAIDIDNDGVVDIVYAGDYSGNLYRFDLRSPKPSEWTVHKLFSAGAPITSAPSVILVKNANINNNNSLTGLTAIVTFGTGSDIYQSDLTNKNQQAVYGIYDNLSISSPSEISKETDLLQQQLTISGKYRMLSDYKFNPKSHRGWFFNLESDTGERVVSKPIVASYAGAVISRKYELKKDDKPEDPCKVTERKQESDVYSGKIQYNIKTGGLLKKSDPHFVFDKKAPVGAASTSQGLYSFTLSGNSSAEIGGSLTQSSLVGNGGSGGNGGPGGGPGGPNTPSFCTNKPIIAVDTDGNVVTVNIPRCPVKFQRLSWKEVKTGYIN